MSAPAATDVAPSTFALLLDERERHAATRAQLEIVAEELRAATDLVAIVSDALKASREECNTLRQSLRDLALEHDRLETTIARMRGDAKSSH